MTLGLVTGEQRLRAWPRFRLFGFILVLPSQQEAEGLLARPLAVGSRRPRVGVAGMEGWCACADVMAGWG